MLALLPASWLLPNHYTPWVSAWLEGLAILVLASAALAAWRRTTIPALWLAAGAIALGSIALQGFSGRITYAGDAVMAAYYIGVLMLSLALGAALAGPRGSERVQSASLLEDAPSTWSLGVAWGAIGCVSIALVQWTDISFARMWITDLPPWARPYSNLAQPNHFCSAAFLGITALALLRESDRIGPTGFWVGASFLLLGMALSGSRTAWVQLAIAVAMLAWLGRRLPLKMRAGQIAGLAAIYAMLAILSGPLDVAFGRDTDRPLAQKMASGTRPTIWRDMVTAIAKEPLAGNGWQQVGAARQRVALDRPMDSGRHEHVDHSHNLVLDLLVWAGIPAGGAILLLAGMAIVRQVRRLADARAAWLMVGVLGLLAHAMLEFPLEFAYFLIPFGVALGMLHRMSTPGQPLPLSRWWLPGAAAGMLAVLALIASDYIEAEENYRVARFEIARIGTDRITSEAADLRVLSQVEAYLRFMRTEPKEGMSAQALEDMRLVSERFGFASSMFRYALALGLNGRSEEAGLTLKRLCHIQSPRYCREARAAWQDMQERHEALRAVPTP